MKVVVLLTVVASVAAQATYNQGGHNGFGAGGAIIFPDDGPVVVRPHQVYPGQPGLPVRPIQPGLPVRPIQPAQPVLPIQPAQPVFPIQPAQPLLPIQTAPCNGQTLVHAQQGSSDYHFSWCADGGQKYDWRTANNYCSQTVGPGWIGVSIEDISENQFVTQVIANNQLDYIWTSGQKIGSTWTWGSQKTFIPLDWSHTGLDNLPQPDNRENNAENCLGILNDFYQDGIKWHDIACHHTKPIICERPS